MNGMSRTMARLRGRRKLSGFTLIEMMIVVVIIGILAAIAYPSYQEQVRKTRRSDGKVKLMEIAQGLERCYSRYASYNNANCNVATNDESDERYYAVTGEIETFRFTLTATPQGDQVKDSKCGALSLTHDGVEGADGDPDDCW